MNATLDTSRAADGLYACGHALLTEGRVADAACVFRALAAAMPEEERGWLGLGACHEAIGQHSVAIELYGTAEELVASPARTAVAKARALRIMGRDDLAEAALDSAADLAIGDADLEMLVRLERTAS